MRKLRAAEIRGSTVTKLQKAHYKALANWTKLHSGLIMVTLTLTVVVCSRWNIYRGRQWRTLASRTAIFWMQSMC